MCLTFDVFVGFRVCLFASVRLAEYMKFEIYGEVHRLRVDIYFIYEHLIWKFLGEKRFCQSLFITISFQILHEPKEVLLVHVVTSTWHLCHHANLEPMLF